MNWVCVENVGNWNCKKTGRNFFPEILFRFILTKDLILKVFKHANEAHRLELRTTEIKEVKAHLAQR